MRPDIIVECEPAKGDVCKLTHGYLQAATPSPDGPIIGASAQRGLALLLLSETPQRPVCKYSWNPLCIPIESGRCARRRRRGRFCAPHPRL